MTNDIFDPEIFAAHLLFILNKQKKLVPLKWNKAQRHFHNHRTGRDIVLKARQLGVSTYIQGEMFRRTVTGTRTTITLSHDSDTTQKLRRMADRFYNNFPNVRPVRKYANASLTTYPGFDSTATIATAGNVDTGRGDTYTDFHGSEVAFWPDAERIIAGAMQGGNPDVILESTANGAQGHFHELCTEALSGDSVWTLHFYPWWWDEDYRIPLDDGEIIEYTDDEQVLVDKYVLASDQIKWRRLKQKELKRLFFQEYPEDTYSCFITSGDSYFGDLSNVFIAPLGAEYNPDHEYVAGLDFGQTNDFTAMPVKDKTSNVQVDLLHIRKLPWAEQRKRIVQMYRKWNCKRLGAEMNSIGSPNVEALRRDGINVIGFTTTNASKAEIMSDLYENIHTGGLKLLDIPEQKQEMMNFSASQTATGIWRLAAAGDGHDDIVIALGIMEWASSMPTARDLVDFA